jgi:hypothetical protein
MSISTVNAKLYISRVIGGGNSAQIQDLAGEALLRGYSDWEVERDWEFLLKDTTVATVIAGLTATAASAVVNAAVAGSLDFANVGQGVTISASDTATLVADTTIASIVRGVDGVVTSITLSNAFGGTTDISSTLTFTADIPLIVGTNDYALPNDFGRAYTCRELVDPRTLTFRRQRLFDRLYPDQTLQGLPLEYTTYNPYSPLTQNFGETRLKFDVIPSAIGTIRLRYYRKFITTGTNVDMPDDLLYKFLDYCRSVCLDLKRAQDDPAGYRRAQLASLKDAGAQDEEVTEDNDADNVMKSQYEMFGFYRGFWR